LKVKLVALFLVNARHVIGRLDFNDWQGAREIYAPLPFFLIYSIFPFAKFNFCADTAHTPTTYISGEFIEFLYIYAQKNQKSNCRGEIAQRAKKYS